LRNTKFIVVLSDGMADVPLDELGGKTPLEAALTPHMDAVAAMGVVGLVDVIPATQKSGSDVGNLSVLGYDPDQFLTGRAPLEAASMGVDLAPDEVAYRCNLVTLRDGLMDDYSAGHISSEEAAELIEAVDASLGNDRRRFTAGVQYRHLLVVDEAFLAPNCTPPHDIMGEPFENYLPTGDGSDELRRWIRDSQDVLSDHPVNRKRAASGKPPANSIWLWGQGKAPTMPTYEAKYGIRGAAISAVDLVRGIARYAGLRVIPVPGITGFLDTNYAGKAIYGLASLDDGDFIYIHVEAPDEAAHLGDAAKKIQAIEAVDSEVVARVLDYLQTHPNTRVGILPDHITAIPTRTHAHGAVPFAACGVGLEPVGVQTLSEASAARSRVSFPVGYRWMDWFLGAG
jgi:2,3-bisphosphoglycerate-independent phosphoglycerate mutase